MISAGQTAPPPLFIIAVFPKSAHTVDCKEVCPYCAAEVGLNLPTLNSCSFEEYLRSQVESGLVLNRTENLQLL